MLFGLIYSKVWVPTQGKLEWATRRLEFSQQLSRQMVKARRINSGAAKYRPLQDGLDQA
jgi:hypothetical protein